jgi:hypothetical protein
MLNDETRGSFAAAAGDNKLIDKRWQPVYAGLIHDTTISKSCEIPTCGPLSLSPRQSELLTSVGQRLDGRQSPP